MATEAAAPAASTPDESSKLKAFASILRKFIGVADIATARFSLPAQLLEPTPNLEFWNYLDRPETFASIGKSDDELGRMMEVLRFWFTKDIKYVKGKPCKPYNSVLGEFFRCSWETKDSEPAISPASSSSSSSNTTAVSGGSDGTARDENGDAVKIAYLTEQTSHHPPVSAYLIDCPQRGLSARGYDQISAKFTGTAVRISPGEYNQGIFITLHQRDNEEYQLTHPVAHVGGFLRGGLAISVGDMCYITCPKSRIKCILQYHEDGWLSRAHYKVVGSVFRYDPDNDNKTKLKDVSDKDVLAKIDGSWHEKIYYTLTGSKDRQLLIDLSPLHPASKTIPPEENQLPNESRRFWGDVTEAILAKQYGLATKAKHDLEERQREKAAKRKENNETWQPRFFTTTTDPSGKPEVTEDGKLALNRILEDNYDLEENKEYAA